MDFIYDPAANEDDDSDDSDLAAIFAELLGQ
jgi:hypothetical protein